VTAPIDRPEDEMNADMRKQHAWLMQWVGQWRYEFEGTCGPGAEAQIHRGTETVRALGDAWLLCEGRGEMPETDDTQTLMTLGYDPLQACVVGSWIGSMMTHFWVYRGEIDLHANRLTLDAEGPSFSVPGRMARYRDTIELAAPDRRVLSARVLGDDGVWRDMMRAEYHRV
jgi:hypothetical protein